MAVAAAAAAAAEEGEFGGGLAGLPVLPGGGDPAGPAGALLVRAADGRALGLVAAPGGRPAEEGGGPEPEPEPETEPEPELEPEEVRLGLDAVRGLRESGNAAFAAGELELAVERYGAALARLSGPPLLGRTAANSEALPLHCNLAATSRRLRDAAAPEGGGVQSSLNERVLAHCAAALALEPRSVKALYRQAEAQAWAGALYAARASLDRALRTAPDHPEVLALSDACDDGLEAGKALDTPEGAGGGGGGAGPRGRATPAHSPNEGAPPPPLPEEFVPFLAGVRRRVAQELEEKGGVTAAVHLRHPREEEGQGGMGGDSTLKDGSSRPGTGDGYAFGTVDISGAFDSLQNLRECCAFIRGQHFAHAADCACVVVDKARVRYPVVWWAHPWPGDPDDAGLFLEAHWRTKGGGHATWFLPLAPGVALGEPIALHPEAALLDGGDTALFLT